MGRRKYNQGRVTDYSGADMVDPVQRRKAMDDYIGRTGWKMTQVQRSEMVNAACNIAEQQIANQVKQASRGTTAGQSPGHSGRPSAPADGSEAAPLTWRNAWKAWV